jgi:hypothetical protein
MRSNEYENQRHSGGVGSPPTDCRPVVHGGLHVGGCGALRGRVDFFDQALEAGLAARRRGRPGRQAATASALPACRRAEGATRRDLVAGPVGRRVLQRPLDLCPRGAGDPTRIRRDVPCRPRRPHLARFGLHAAKAATQSARARRSRDRALAARRLAAHQKRGARRKASIVFLDETGFMLQPLNRRTWAPRGQRA